MRRLFLVSSVRLWQRGPEMNAPVLLTAHIVVIPALRYSGGNSPSADGGREN